MDRPPGFAAALDDWLDYVERTHSKPIDLGLERVQAVREALALAPRCPVITVAGTNGKGSTCAMLEAILRAEGYRTGLYTSPHLLRYNERVRIDGAPADDAALVAAFARAEAARAGTPLTYFEFGTLVAWLVFDAQPLDVMVLEVGLGGRLDAVNALDADCAVLTSIDLDHMEFLGPDRESIGREKSGIFRPGRPAIVGDPLPPASVLEHARTIGAELRVSGRDFGYAGDRQQWQYWSRREGAVARRSGLAYPALRGANQLLNAAAALAALDALRERLPVAQQSVRRGLMEVELPGRFQVLPGKPSVVLDVAHNPHAAAVLSENLSSQGYFPETWAVFGMLRDKDIAGVVERLRGRIDHWLIADLPGPRGARSDDLARALAVCDVARAPQCFATPGEAYAAARERAAPDDRILAFGSFLTVADVMRAISTK